MKLTAEQSKNVQVLRGLAIIAVVLIHNTPTGLAQVFCKPFLNFSVGLFLFLSGMLSNASGWNPKRRIFKVFIPYVLWTLIYSVMHNISNPVGIVSAFVEDVLTGRATVAMYYIFVYCELTLLIPLIDKLAKSKYKYWGFAITPIEIIVMRTIPLVTRQEVHPYISVVMSVSCLGWFTYFYLGYLLGNKLISVNTAAKKLPWLWVISILLQFVEGYYYHTLGYKSCGTQLKLTAIVSGVLFVLMAYHYVMYGKSDHGKALKALSVLGDTSFGIYFAHLAVMFVVEHIPGYTKYVVYPLNGVIAVALTTVCVLFGRKILGKYSKYLAL